MTDMEKREAARQFFNKWNGKGREDEEDRSFWLDILQRIMGAEDATDRIDFQKKVIVDGNTKRIDAYIPETKIIIEQKSLGIALDKKVHQSGGIDLTPYEQAKRYNDNLPSSEKARWIVTSNFSEIWVYDMDTKEPEKHITAIKIADLQSHYSMLDFLLSKKVKTLTKEMELSLKAGDLVGKIYNSLLKQYRNPEEKAQQNSLNILCVRLVFCMYAEDAMLFGSKDAFSKYIQRYEPCDIRNAFIELFKVLDTPLEDRADLYLSEELEAFPYCNGGLFEKEDIIIPRFTQEIKEILQEAAQFNWSKISPTIFGAVFESTLNPITRREGGMHYTSIENIHKVIDPLFLDDLKQELSDIRKIGVKNTCEKKLREFQGKLASLTFFDPACGSGNFLTETYISIRRLENEVIRELYHGQMVMGETIMPIQVSIHQFYGIEINDFAVTVAKTALWIAESQMMKETEDIVLMHLDFLPLKTNATIVEGNALRMNWEDVVPKDRLSYIMGNPPFVGYTYQSEEQKNDLQNVESGVSKKIDYVAGWYFKAAQYMKNTQVCAAFVSTNSVTQGEQVPSIWKPLFQKYGVIINFAHRTFIWDSEASLKAHVHCVIIGFSCCKCSKNKIIYADGNNQVVKNINGYLTDECNIFIEKRTTPLSNDTPEMIKGSQPTDGGNLIITQEEYGDFIKGEPNAEKWIHLFLGSDEFLSGKSRYCLWLPGISPKELNKMPHVLERIRLVKEFRLKSKKAATRKWADMPTLFTENRQPSSKFIAIPEVSSGNRRYIPMDFLHPDTICSNKLQMIPNATIYHFGVMMSNVHMAWMRAVCGRLKSDYDYSAKIVYNNFPWPTPAEEQKSKIEQTAQGILDARALYPDCSLADLYDPLTMPENLRKAHRLNDAAVMKAYGLSVKDTSEADCVAFLMKRYQEMTKNV